MSSETKIQITTTPKQKNCVPTVVSIRKKKGIGCKFDIYIGRQWKQYGWNLPQSKWHNPFSVQEHGRQGAIDKYREYLENNSKLLQALPELAGKVLGCWCKPEPCHGDVLVELFRKHVGG